jgi:hypothetical protein
MCRRVHLVKSLCTGKKAAMKFFENWWERAPLIARAGLVVLSIVGMLLGGAADAYWD